MYQRRVKTHSSKSDGISNPNETWKWISSCSTAPMDAGKKVMTKKLSQ